MKRSPCLRQSESLTTAFIAMLIAVVAAFLKKIPAAPALFFTYSVLLITQFALIYASRRYQDNWLAGFGSSVVFPIICVLAVFDSLEQVVHYINPRDIDPFLIRLDYLIFGGYPTVMMESFNRPLLTDVLQISYTTYYFLPIALCLILRLRGMEQEFDKAVFIILFCFYLSYTGYLLFPALGPRFTINHLQSSELRGIVIAEPLQHVLNKMEGIKRDAFPSGHTAVSLVVLCLAYRVQRRFFYVAAPVVVMLLISTVYCRYHYAVDVIGGAVLAAGAFFIGGKYYEYREAGNNINN